MSDSEISDGYIEDILNIKDEINTYKKNAATSEMFVSGWDDADQDIEVVEDPKADPNDYALWVAEHGKIDILKELLSSKPSLLHIQDSDGYTLLHRASYSNHVKVISYLLSLGANIGMKTEMGWTPLHSACNWNNYLAVARLLGAGADLRSLSDGAQTPLHLASAISNCKSTLLLLLMRDDTVDIATMKNNTGETPEQLAKRHGIYGLLYEMVDPAVSYIKSLAFTCNSYIRYTQHKFETQLTDSV